MKVKKREFESKNIQTFFVINQKEKIFKNKRKYNELFNNKINLKDYEKCFKYRSLRNSLENIINDKQSKLFNTEVENKNNFLSNRINYSILGRKKKIFNANNYSLSPVNNLKKTIFNTVLDMCHDLYESKNKDNNKRMKLREDILDKVNHYVNKDLKKNILCPEIFDTKKKKEIELIIPNKIKKVPKLKSVDSNKINLKSIIKKYSEQPKLKTINLKNSRIITYENYANNNINYNHPQIYTLNNNIKKYFGRKTQKNLKTYIDFSKLIPERKIDQKEINKQLYSVYKTMKKRKDIAFHI